MRSVNLEKWRGKRDPVAIDPEKIEFKVQRAGSCRGCMCAAQWSAVCNQASKVGAERGLPDCTDGYIYVIVERDPRQIALIP